MSTSIVGAQRTWSGNIDADGHRTWNITFQTQGNAGDGPASHVQTPGLPVEGSIWAFDNDLDIWAWCRSGPTTIQPRTGPGKVNTHFDITYLFSTRPLGSSGSGGGGGGGSGPTGGATPSGGTSDKAARKKCADQRIEDPLLEPPATTGSSVNFSEEATVDRLGAALTYTSGEQIRGALVTFDNCRTQVVIEHNVLDLELEKLEELKNTVHTGSLWDLPTRSWKLGSWTWSRKSYGTCSFYYTRRLVFEGWVKRDRVPYSATFGQLVSGWDKDVLDESSKCIKGDWAPGAIPQLWIATIGADATNPNDYINAHDIEYQPQRVILSHDQPGYPAFDKDDYNYIHIEYHDGSNFFDLGIPVSLE